MIRNCYSIFKSFLQPKVFCSSASSVINKENESLILKLSKNYDDVASIKYALKQAGLRNVPFNEWKSRIDLLKTYDFKDKDCFQIVSRYPPFLQIPLKKLQRTIEQWFNANLGMRYFQLILLKQPEFCSLNEEDIRERVPYLRALFRSSEALGLLLLNSPNVMYDDWEVTLNKIDYLKNERKYTMGEIVQSHALSKSLDFVKMRIDVLEKTGVFRQDLTPYHKINKYDKSRHINPPLKDILLTSTAKFAALAKISSEEYMMCTELWRLYEDDHDSDDENEDDSDVED